MEGGTPLGTAPRWVSPGAAHRAVIQDDVAAGHVAMKNVLLQVLDEGALWGETRHERCCRLGGTLLGGAPAQTHRLPGTEVNRPQGSRPLPGGAMRPCHPESH